VNRDAPDFLRLKECPQCGYDLAGLPREHACPECGFEYSAEIFDLCGTHNDIHATRWWLPLPLFGIGIVVAIVQAWIGASPWIFVAAVAVMGVVLCTIWLVVWRIISRKSRRRSTYLFGPGGVVGPRHFDEYEWSELGRATAIPICDGQWRVSVPAARVWWRYLGPRPVDLVVKGCEKDITAAVMEINRRIQASRRVVAQDDASIPAEETL